MILAIYHGAKSFFTYMKYQFDMWQIADNTTLDTSTDFDRYNYRVRNSLTKLLQIFPSKVQLEGNLRIRKNSLVEADSMYIHYSKSEYGIRERFQAFKSFIRIMYEKWLYTDPRMYNVYIHDFSMISRVQLYVYTYADEDHEYEEAS